MWAWVDAYKWAGGFIPEIYVKSIVLNENTIDIIIIKRSDNTPFYLTEDYTNVQLDSGNQKQKVISKGAIFTRTGDTNTPKNKTANLYDTELLWKRRFGILLAPSQRANIHLKDLKNWERVDGEPDKNGKERFFFYHKLDPEYTIHTLDVSDDSEISSDINNDNVGSQFYYLYTFCNVSYHTDFSNNAKIVLYYKDIPLCSSPFGTY